MRRDAGARLGLRLRGVIASVLIGVMTAGSVLAGMGQPAAADSGTCSPPADSFVNVPGVYIGNDFGPQLCGVFALETQAYDAYVSEHNLSGQSQALIEASGQAEIIGQFWTLMMLAAEEEAHNPSSMTPAQQGAYQWLASLVSGEQVAAAQDAQNEYTKWQHSVCTYVPPNPKLFSFAAALDPYCSGTMASLFAGPTPPSYTDFIEYGQYDAEQQYGIGANNPPPYADVVDQQTQDGAIGFGALLTTPLLQRLFGNLESRVNLSQRGLRTLKSKMQSNAAKSGRVQQEVQDLQKSEELKAQGKPVDQNLERVAGEGETELDDAGFDWGSFLSDIGVDFMTGPAVIVGLAAAILVTESTSIANQQQIPGELASNITSTTAATKSASYLWNLVSDNSGGGYQTVYQLLMAQVSQAAPSIGLQAGSATAAAAGQAMAKPAALPVSAAAKAAATASCSPTGSVYYCLPSDGTQLEVSFANSSGQTAYTEYVPSIQLAAWPLGVDMGAYGAPTETVGVADGLIWHTPNPDQTAAGMQGYLPSGALHYFTWSGEPRIAFIRGDEFVDMPSTGSIDVGNADLTDLCAVANACTITNTLEAIWFGGNSVKVDPATGSVQGGQDIRLSIKPDPGAIAAINVNNQYGAPANSNPGLTTNGLRNGGLIAGQTVQLTDPEANPLGYATTYTWQVQTLCPYSPGHPTQMVQGVPVCYGSPDYGKSALPANEQDLTVGCPSACAEDPAFHGDPVETLTGQTVNYTWPGPGTYHIRLITSDGYGTTVQSDQDLTIVGAPVATQLAISPGMAGLAAVGPVQNGGTVTVTGCITTPVALYGDPQVSVNWGDGTTDTQSAQSAGDAGLQFAFEPGGGCTGPWSFTASHAFNLPTPEYGALTQLPLAVTVTDGLGGTQTFNLYTNVTFLAKPSFTSANATTFTPGSLGYFTVTTGGAPTPSLSLTSGSLPSGVSFDAFDNGTAVITGDTSAGGSYPVTIEATNSQGTTDQSFTLTVDTSPAITSGPSATLTAGQAGSVTFTTTGYPAPALSITGAADGLTFTDNGDGTATLTGTPADTGTYPLTLQASSSVGKADQPFDLIVSRAPAFTSAASAGFAIGNASSFLVTTAGWPAATLTMSGNLPSGLYFHDNGNGTADIYGTATAAASKTVTITATNSVGHATQNLTVTASSTAGPIITFGGGAWAPDVDEAAFDANTAGSLTITSSPAAQLSLAGTLPAGLTFNGGSGSATISGTAAAAGTYGLKVTATASDGSIGYAFLDLLVLGPPTVTSAGTATFLVGSPGSFIVTTGGVAVPALSESGQLPAGLTFTNNGDGTATLAGTPSAAGTSTLTLSAESVLGTTTSTLTIDVQRTPAITSAGNAGFGAGVAGTFAVTTSGSPTPSLRVSGLPSGFTFTDNGDGTGTIAGTPAAGTLSSYALTVTATSAAGTTTQALTLQVGPPPAFASPALPAFTAGQPGSVTVSASVYGRATITATGLPAWLTLADNGAGTATLSGTPTAGGVVPVSLTVTDAYGTATQELTVEVDQASAFLGTAEPTCSAASAATTTASFLAGYLNQWTLCASGYPHPQLSLSAGSALPPGVTFTDNGDGSATIQGTPASGTGGTYALTLDVGSSLTEPLMLTVNDPVQPPPSVDRATFIAGQPNTYTLVASGYPRPSFSFMTTMPVPSWLQLHDNGNGTATVTGTPPASAVGAQVSATVLETQGVGVGNDFFPDPLFITVAAIGLTADTPPAATVGSPYSYAFTATGSGTVFSATYAADLPPGLTLSPSGMLSGTPTTVGTSTFTLVATQGSSSVTSAPITLTVGGGSRTLQISQFRLIGPSGVDDWFAEVENATSVPIALDGWSLDMAMPGNAPIPITLGTGYLPPGGTVVVAGPYFSLAAKFIVNVQGPPSPSDPGGFAVVAPDGTVTDAAGEAGVPAAVVAGTGVTPPAGAAIVAQDAFVRKTAGGVLVNTGNNASDFTYGPAVGNLAGAGVPSQLVWTTEPGNGTVGSPLNPEPVLALEDQYGNVVTSDSTDTVTLDVASGSGNLDGTTTVTLHDGVATFSGLALDAADTYTLAPSTSALGVTTLPDSSSFTVTPGAVTLMPQALSVAAGGTLTVSGSVYANGSPVANPQVVLTPAGDFGTVATSVYGGYGATFHAPQTPGAVTVSASVYGVGAASALILVTPAADPAQSISAGIDQAAIPDLSAAGSGGTGQVEVASYGTDPAGAATFSSAGQYFDVAVGQGSNFTSLTISQCGATANQTLYWWNGTVWGAVYNPTPTFDAGTGCLDATLSATSSPSLSQLGGTPFAVGSAASGGGGSQPVVSFTPAPTVSSLSPASGVAGTVVTITGSGFYAPASVRFGTAQASAVTVQSSTQIQATAPAGTGTVDVTVTTPYGTSLTGSGDTFTYSVPTAQSQPAVTFSDVPPSYWAYQAIATLAGKGIVNGFPDGTFQPGGPVTRAEFVKMLDLTLGLKPGSGQTVFADVPAAAWYAPYVTAAVAAGIVDGTSATTFSPNASLSREQMAVMLARALKLSGTATLRFTDDAQIDGWAQPGVEAAVAAGYLKGFPDGSLQPLAAATRAQAAEVLAAALAARG